MRGITRRAIGAAAILALSGGGRALAAQNLISVPFTNGFIGTRGSSAGTANNVLTYATLGIARTFFIQSSSTTTFELQGNDIPGTLRIVRTDGVTVDMPASANWRNSGGSTFLIGILPRPASPVTFTYSGGSIQITDGANSGGSSIGGYIAAYGGSTLADGASTSGNAAQSQVLSGLNSYLSTVVSSRPNGPVTVTALSTTSTTPTVTGTATLGAGENLSVVVAGVQHTTSSTPAVAINGTNWSLALTTPLAVGTYSVTATITDANGFTLSDATSNELVITSAGGTVTIGGSFTANGKTYDATTAATGSVGGLTLAGVNAPDQVTIASVTLAFSSASAGAGKTVAITAVTLGGANAGLYTVSLAGAPTATANITQAALTITGVAANGKTYDGTTAATLSGTAVYSGLVGGESFAVTGTPSASFASAGIGAAKAVTVSGYTAPTANYSLSQPSGLTATITAKTLTIGGSFTASDKAFDGNTTATIATNALTTVGVVSGESVSLTSVAAEFADAGVGTGKTVSVTSASLAGPDVANYVLSLAGAPTTTASITTAGATVTISGSFTANDKTYDGTTTATGATGGLSLSGVVAPDQVTIASVSLAFQSAAAGTAKTVVITSITLGGADAAHYAVSVAGAPTAMANVVAKGLTVTGVTAADKTYDGTTAATLAGAASYAGLVAGESFAVSGTPSATFASPGIGVAKAVTVAGYAAPNANYTVTQPTGLTASIAALSLSIGGSFTAPNKTFDGTTGATITTNALVPVGVVGGESVTLTGVTVAFADAAIGTGKAVSVTSASLGGSDAANYVLSLVGAPTTTADITSAGGTVTIGGGFTANDKTYDGATAATGSVGGLTLVGVTAPDQVTIASVTLAFQSAAVGSGKTVVITGVTLGGANAGQYAMSLAGAPTASASITAKVLTIGGSFAVANKQFDGTTGATITTNALVPVGVVGGESVTLTGVAAAFGSAAVGVAKSVTITAATASGPTAANYALSLAGAPTTTATVFAAPVPTPPTAPLSVVATPGDRSITVAWAPPATSGCGAVTGYVVEYSADGGRGWTPLSVVSPPAVITGLTNNIPHWVRVAAVNTCGVGGYSAAVGPIVPVGPTRDDAGRPQSEPPGTATTTSGGVRRQLTVGVVQDTIVRLTDEDVTLQLRAIDEPGAAIPVDTTLALQLEQGGRVTAGGTGFGPGTFTTLYLFPPNGRPVLLGLVPVRPDGSFDIDAAIADTLAPGSYTLQVNGVDAGGRSRSLALGVEVAPPPPDLVLTATPSDESPAIGDTLVIALTVTNQGRGPATDVVIPRAFREPGFAVIGTTPLDGTYAAATQEWTIRRIDPGARARLLLTVVVLPTAIPPGTQP